MNKLSKELRSHDGNSITTLKLPRAICFYEVPCDASSYLFITVYLKIKIKNFEEMIVFWSLCRFTSVITMKYLSYTRRPKT